MKAVSNCYLLVLAQLIASSYAFLPLRSTSLVAKPATATQAKTRQMVAAAETEDLVLGRSSNSNKPRKTREVR